MHNIIALLGGDKMCDTDTCDTKTWPQFPPSPYDAAIHALIYLIAEHQSGNDLIVRPGDFPAARACCLNRDDDGQARCIPQTGDQYLVHQCVYVSAYKRMYM